MAALSAPPLMPTNTAPRLSLCMIVKDEAEGLEAVIESVRGLVDEIVIVDTGSEDGTWPLVQTLAHRCAQHPWQDHFAQARNSALALATGDFVLVLDGDEALSDGHEQISEAIRQPGLLAAELLIKNELEGGEVGEFWACRLFRRHPDMQWAGRIHEQILPAAQTLMAHQPGFHLARVQATISHSGYLPAAFAKGRKAERNVRLLSQAVAELDDNSALSERVYLEYKLAMALGAGPVGRNHMLRAAGRLLEASKPDVLGCGVAPELLVAASQAWRQGGATDRAIASAELAKSVAPDHPMPALVLGQAWLQSGHCDKAADAAVRARSCGAGGFYFDAAGFDVALTVLDAGISERRGRSEEALAHLQKLTDRQPDSAQAAAIYVATMARVGDPKQAIVLGLSHMKVHGGTARLLLACADAADRLGKHAKAVRWREMASPKGH